MKLLVLGLAAFANSVVPAREGTYGDWHADPVGTIRAERQVVLSRGEAAEVAVEPRAAFTNGEDPASADPSPAEGEAAEAESDPEAEGMGVDAGVPGAWQLACRIKNGGGALLFDRASLRDYGGVTLFRWSAANAAAAGAGPRVFTGVVNCREKTIEPSWPGRSRGTRSGTCGRGLVDAVCAAATPAAPLRHRPASTHSSAH